MSKSRRVFLSIKGNDDFWGNGDRHEEKKSSTVKHHKCRVIKDDRDEMKEKYFFEQNKLGHQHLEQSHHDDVKAYEERDWKMRSPLEDEVEGKTDDKVFIGWRNESIPRKEQTSDSESLDCAAESEILALSEVEKNMKHESHDSTDANCDEAFYNNYSEYFNSRPEVKFLIQSMDENALVQYDKSFIDLYERIRKRLEMHPNSQFHQILRCTGSSNTSTRNSEQRVRNKHVVSSFREPDRRLGRYSKYYYHHNVGPEVYSRKVFVGGLPVCVKEGDILNFFSRYGRLQVDWPSKHYGCKSDSYPSLCNEPMSSSSFQPTSHLAMVSPPFGQINPFITDPQPAPDSQSNGFNRQFIGQGGGFLNQRLAPNGNVGIANVGSRNDGSVGEKRQQHLGYVFLLYEKERSVRDLVSECVEEEEGLFITLESSVESIRVQIRPWLLADAEFLMDFNVPINTKLVAFIGGVPRPLKAVELAHFFEQTYGNVVCVGIDIDNKFKYPRGSGRVAFSNYDAYVQAITDRYIVLDHEDIHKRVEIKPYFFHNQSCEECSGPYHRQHAPFFCPSLECFQYYCEPCWHKMHAHPSRFHHMPVVKGV